MPDRPIRPGFTAVELLISMSLSLLICLAAFTAFRSSAQTIDYCNRLSNENAALRDGFIAVIDDLDFWHSIDDMDGNPGPRALRNDPSFSWMSGQPAREANGQKGPFSSIVGTSISPGNPELPWSWFVDDPASWYRLEGYINSVNDNSGFWNQGKYASIQACSTSAATCTPRHALPNCIIGIWDKAGMYACLDLLPAGTIYTCYSNDLNSFDVIRWRCSNSTEVNKFTGTYSIPYGAAQSLIHPPQSTPVSANRLLAATATFKINPPLDLSRLTSFRNNTAVSLSSRPTDSAGRKVYEEVVNSPINLATSSGQSTLLDFCRMTTIITPIKPASGLDISVSTRRCWLYNRPWNYCAINVFNSKTGNDATLSFNCLGTTLRGARQQRDIGIASASRINR